MSDTFDRLQTKQDHDLVVRRREAEFQEVPGEEAANAARDAYLARATAGPGALPGALAEADGGTRARLLNRLQREHGNAYAQRVVSESRGTPGRLVGLSQSEMVDEVRERKGPGGPLPEDTRVQMEGFFGADLGSVRVHDDGEAAALNRELNAQAFTVGHDVFFAEGKYDPGTAGGQGLLAHELAHVGQQTGFGGQPLQRQGEEEEVQMQAEEEEEEVQTQAEEEEEEEVQTQAEEEEEEEAGG